MAELGVSRNAFLSINGVDLSDHVRSLSVPQGVGANDDTVMGDTTDSNAAALLNWNGSAEFNQDYAAGSVDATLNAALGTVVSVIYRPDAGVVAATNPQYTGNALITSYTPAAGGVKDQAVASCDWVSAGALTRTTS